VFAEGAAYSLAVWCGCKCAAPLLLLQDVGVGAASLVFAVSDLPDPASSFDCCLEWLLGAAPFLCCRVDVMCSRGSH
jgi:hypothetical protein